MKIQFFLKIFIISFIVFAAGYLTAFFLSNRYEYSENYIHIYKNIKEVHYEEDTKIFTIFFNDGKEIIINE